jgi:hypothetical protein
MNRLAKKKGFMKSESKYGSQKVETDGYSFSSKLELAVYQMLRHRLMAGEIKAIQVQAHVYLTDACILFIPDFRCTLANGDDIFVEAKGFQTDVYRIKRRLWMHYGPSELHIYKGSYTRLYLDEIIKPKGKYEANRGSPND